MKNKTEKALPENVLKEGLGKTDFKTDKVCADAELSLIHISEPTRP